MSGEMVSVIVPAYNEGRVLGRNVRQLQAILERNWKEYEIIISEDGSSDGTADIAKSLVSSRIRLVRNGRRAGKGAAIKSAAARARGSIIMFMDADLASNPKHVAELVRKLMEGADIVVGSRYHPESVVRRTWLRYAASRGFNWLVNVLLGSRLTDHQCGFKAFRKDRVLPVVESASGTSWFWDTELLVNAQRKGLTIAEVPVEWHEGDDSRFRLVNDTIHMGVELLLFKIRHG